MTYAPGAVVDPVHRLEGVVPVGRHSFDASRRLADLRSIGRSASGEEVDRVNDRHCHNVFLGTEIEGLNAVDYLLA